MKITLKDGSVFEGTAQEYAELVKLGEGIAETKDEYVPKVGDKVRALSDSEFYDIEEGEIGVVTSVDAPCGDFDNYSNAVRTEEEQCYFRPQDLELVKEEESLVKGDYVVALPSADENYSVTTTEMQLGEVRDVQDDFLDIKIIAHSTRKGFAGDTFSVKSKYFRKATDEEVAKFKKEYTPKEGDIVVITGNTNNSLNKVGDIGKVGIVLITNIARVYVPGRPSVNYTKFDEMRLATDEEKKQYDQAEKFAKLGRKPGEFRKGDIVKALGGSGGHVDVIGEIDNPNNSSSTGTVKMKAIYTDGRMLELHSHVELIAPVESRVDRVD